MSFILLRGLPLLMIIFSIEAQYWSYKNTTAWGESFPQCNGKHQSPIAVSDMMSLPVRLPSLKFTNYDVLLKGPLTFRNNGHTLELTIPVTVNEQRPYITGGGLRARYEAQSLHFHWGSPINAYGSEHAINKHRYNVEMHIVHRNEHYNTTEEALKKRDGLSVLAIMLNADDYPDYYFPGLLAIFNAVPYVSEYESTTIIEKRIKLGHILGDLNTKNFYSYYGSLTTPPCSEAVIWNIFPKPVIVEREQLERLFDVKDLDGDALWNNYRPLQRCNQCTVYRKRGDSGNPIFKPLFSENSV